jgi:hypothetical protein
MGRERLLVATIVGATLFGFYLPSALGSVISRPLGIVSIAGTCLFLAAMWVLSDRPAPPINVVCALSIALLLAVFTVTSPFEAMAPGVTMLYLAQVLLFLLNLRHLRSPAVERVFAVTSAASLMLGYALALNVGVVDRVMLQWYQAFYPELLGNMIVLSNKPVLTFATHSMAGFMIYLLFYMHLRAWTSRRGWWRLGAASGFLGLLVLLQSTTGQAFAAIAGLQLLWLVRFVPAHLRTLAVVALLVAGYGVFVARGTDVEALAARVSEAVVGDRVRGLFSRYAADGLLASSINYLSDKPFTPIGLAATDTLYLGDSGVVVNALRGSVPLLVAVYGALWLFLRANLADGRTAAWIWFCTTLFEIAFTPLQYFRFVAFVPFLVVYLNSVMTPAASAPAVLGGQPAPG